MPNWCNNNVQVEGPAEVIQSLVKALKIDEGKFDFNGVVPMPEELDIEKGSIQSNALDVLEGNWEQFMASPFFQRGVKDASMVKAAIESRDQAIQFFDALPQEAQLKCGLDMAMGRQAIRNRKKYGATDWYDWRIHNWGTKWNVDEIDDLQQEPTSISLNISTAWSPPLGVFFKMAEQYPAATITLKYIEEGMQFAGSMRFEGGILVDEVSVSDDQFEAFALEEFGIEPFEENDDDDDHATVVTTATDPSVKPS